jgi:lysine 6-dehydrogenase
MKVLLLGATGTQGRRAAVELARSDWVDQLLLAGTDRVRVDNLCRLLGNRESIRGITRDGRDPHAIVRFADSADIIVSCAGPAHLTERTVTQAAVRSGTHCVTLGDDYAAGSEAMAFDDEARSAGISIVSGCGFSPGVTNMLACYAAQELDEVNEIGITVAYSLRDHLGPAMMSTLLRAFAAPSAYVSEWQDRSGRAGDLPQLTFLPEPVGWVEAFDCSHPEIASLHKNFPELRNLRYRIGFTERAAMDAIRGAAAIGLGRREALRTTSARVLNVLQPALSALPPRTAPWTGARVDVRGKVDGRTETISLGVADHLANLASLTLIHGARELAANRVDSTGVLWADEALDPDVVFNYLYSRGIRVARLTPDLFDGADSDLSLSK